MQILIKSIVSVKCQAHRLPFQLSVNIQTFVILLPFVNENRPIKPTLLPRSLPRHPHVRITSVYITWWVNFSRVNLVFIYCEFIYFFVRVTLFDYKTNEFYRFSRMCFWLALTFNLSNCHSLFTLISFCLQLIVPNLLVLKLCCILF